MALVKAQRENWRMTRTAALSRGVKVPMWFDPFMPEPKASAPVPWQSSAQAMRSAITGWDKRVRPKRKAKAP